MMKRSVLVLIVILGFVVIGLVKNTFLVTALNSEPSNGEELFRLEDPSYKNTYEYQHKYGESKEQRPSEP